MKIKCPICGAEYEELNIRFCKTCMYSIGADSYLTDLLNHPSENDLEVYNAGIEEYRTLWRERNPEKKIVVSGLVEMVIVDGGTFRMGSNEEYDFAKPVHKVTLSNFLIGKYAVTQELWESVMGNNPSHFKGVKRPVENVSWYDAVEFCNKLSEREGLIPTYKMDKTQKDPSNNSEDDKGNYFVTCDFTRNGYRLPSEAEWEYAARGGHKSKGYTYSGNDKIDSIAWNTSTSGSSTHKVGMKQPNELGLYDMSGNVWEWCWDWDGDYQSGSQTAPKGANPGSDRVVRGGSWSDFAVCCRAVFRYHSDPGHRNDSLGFRLVRTKI